MKLINIAPILIVLYLLSCGSESTSTLNHFRSDDRRLETIRFQAILSFGKTVTIGELSEFVESPRRPYDQIPSGNMKDLLSLMKRGLGDEDVSYYFWDFFHQSEVIALSLEDFAEYIYSASGRRFINKFDAFLDSDNDDQTHGIITQSVVNSLQCELDNCQITLFDVVKNITGTRHLVAKLMQIKNDKEFYDNLIFHLKEDAEAFHSFESYRN